MGESLHPMFQDILKRTDGWTDNVNESSLDYDFLKRHPEMSVAFLTFTGIAVAAGNIGNVLVSILIHRSRLRKILVSFLPINLNMSFGCSVATRALTRVSTHNICLR